MGPEGKVAVVTGAAGGIGGAVAAGVRGAPAPRCVGLDREQADLTRPDEVESFFAGLDRLDVLFNGAGHQRPLARRRPGRTSARSRAGTPCSRTNLKSVFLCSKHAIPLLRAAGGGAIVNLSSVDGDRRRRRGLRHARLPASKAGIVEAHPRDGIPLRAARDPRQRDRPGVDRDADEPAGAEPTPASSPASPSSSRSRATSGGPRTSRARRSTSRRRRSSPAPSSRSTAAGPCE